MNETKKDGLLFGLEVGNTALPSRNAWSLSTISNRRQRKSWFTLLCQLPRVPLKHGGVTHSGFSLGYEAIDLLLWGHLTY